MQVAVFGVEELRENLSQVPAGPMRYSDALVTRLACSWDEFDGSAEGGMNSDKLAGRIECIHWQSPVLRFQIDRHAGTQNGSTRAQVQYWAVDVDAETAYIEKEGHCQIQPCGPRLNLAAIAEDLADLIVRRANDPRLRWISQTVVHVNMSEVFREHATFQRTQTTRSRTTGGYLERLLAPHGWVKLHSNRWQHRPK